MNKSIRNLLISLKNSSTINAEQVCSEYSNKKLNLLRVLYKQGYVQSYSLDKLSLKIFVALRYLHNKPVISDLKILSRTINSKNLSLKHVSKISNRYFTLFISTSEGIYTSLDCKKKKLGGKTLFFS